MPRLLLIYPGNPSIAEKHRGKSRRFPAIGLPVIANLTPPEWDVTFLDEEIGDKLDLESYDPDLVGISSMTSQASGAPSSPWGGASCRSRSVDSTTPMGRRANVMPPTPPSRGARSGR